MSANIEARVLTVALRGNLRDEQLEAVIKAISLIKGVAKVTPEKVDPLQWSADEKARREIRKKIGDILYPPSR